MASTQEVAEAISDRINLEECDVGGIGGTLAGNALSLAAMRATLDKVLTEESLCSNDPLAERWTVGVQQAITKFAMPWHVTRLGCRAELSFFACSSAQRHRGSRCHGLRTGAFHAFFAMNRGVLLTHSTTWP